MKRSYGYGGEQKKVAVCPQKNNVPMVIHAATIISTTSSSSSNSMEQHSLSVPPVQHRHRHHHQDQDQDHDHDHDHHQQTQPHLIQPEKVLEEVKNHQVVVLEKVNGVAAANDNDNDDNDSSEWDTEDEEAARYDDIDSLDSYGSISSDSSCGSSISDLSNAEDEEDDEELDYDFKLFSSRPLPSSTSTSKKRKTISTTTTTSKQLERQVEEYIQKRMKYSEIVLPSTLQTTEAQPKPQQQTPQEYVQEYLVLHQKELMIQKKIKNNSILLSSSATTASSEPLLTLDCLMTDPKSFLTMEEQNQKDYPIVAHATRRLDLSTLQQFHQLQQSNTGTSSCKSSLQCTNAYGETVLHIACRRNDAKDILNFFLTTAKLSLRVKDDMGRTPFHDAVWTATPNFELVTQILQLHPDLLFVKDKRGYSPLSYVPTSQSVQWCNYLQTHTDLIDNAVLSNHVHIIQ